MANIIKKMSSHKGLAPGTLIKSKIDLKNKTAIELIDYNKNNYNEKNTEEISSVLNYLKNDSVTWLNINSIQDTETIKLIGDSLNIHSLVLEDISNPATRPKLEDFGDYIFISAKMVYVVDESIKVEHISFIMGKNYVISFQEQKGDVFDFVRNRIRNNKGYIRNMSSDYLAFALLDAIIDNYFLIIETLGDKVENIENLLLSNPTPKTLQSIHELKRNTIIIRKTIFPLREVISILERGESKLINNSSKKFFKNIYEHTIQVIDGVEALRDIISGMQDVYLSTLSNKMNEVMKTLTIIATIFIPLTFVAGIYGMNFKFMPELEWNMGYFAILFIMFLITIGMLAFFKHKKWL